MYPDSKDIISSSNLSNNIDIRKTLDDVIFHSSPKHAQYLIYRRFDKTKITEHWDDEYKESVGGYKYEHTDEVIVGRLIWYGRGADAENMRPFGEAAFRQPVLACRYTVIPKIEDILFDINTQTVNINTTNISPSSYGAQYDIIQVIPYRNLDGRVEYYACILKEELKNDY